MSKPLSELKLGNYKTFEKHGKASSSDVRNKTLTRRCFCLSLVSLFNFPGFDSAKITKIWSSQSKTINQTNHPFGTVLTSWIVFLRPFAPVWCQCRPCSLLLIYQTKIYHRKIALSECSIMCSNRHHCLVAQSSGLWLSAPIWGLTVILEIYLIETPLGWRI